ncbi:MAG: adenosylcobinamide-GDP ribazoletransferase [Cyclobacteriaceae bacterium]
MKKEIHVFFTALMFYTRIPCPKWVNHDAALLNLSIRYFPLIGWIVGLICAVILYLSALLFSPVVAIILSIVVSILLTGAFHEDGFADTCDAFGGGWTRQQILKIMKDSRLGTYGVTGVFLLLSLKIALIYEIYTFKILSIVTLATILITVHSVSRFIASTFVFTHDYARDSNDSKSKPVAVRTGVGNLLTGFIWSLLPLTYLAYLEGNWWLFLIYLPVYSGKILLARYYTKWIGGYTGDCLGATQQVSEIICYAFLIVLWKFA